MRNWNNFWAKYAADRQSRGLLYQVGKTINGVPITEEQLRVLVAGIIEPLDLRKDDCLVDLCCGNGLLTRLLAPRCRQVTAIDFSPAMIEMAVKHSAAANISYIHMDAKHIDASVCNGAAPTKVLCYEALAYFSPVELGNLLARVVSMCAPSARIFLGGVLDRRSIWQFFDTPARKWNYLVNMKILGREAGLGRWWQREEIATLAKARGLRCEFLAQPGALHTAHYRFDVLLRK